MTIDDLARLAGVSKATVSLALNKDGRIPEATRKRITDLADAHGYRPSTVAKSLRKGTTKAIGLMLPDIINPFFPGILKGVEEVAAQNDFIVIFCNFDENEAKESVYFEMLKDRWVDGIIFSGITGGAEEQKYVRAFEEKGVPIVFIDRGLEGHDGNLVQIDNYDAGYRAATYLIDLGHRRIAFVSGPEGISILRKRKDGYRKALADHRLEVDESLIIEGDISSATAVAAVERILDRPVKPTAIFATSDIVALSMQSELQKRGCRVPEDFSILGFDNLPITVIVHPTLSTVAQPFVEMGRQAMELLLALIQNKDSQRRKVLFNAEIIERESTRAITS